MEYYITQPKDYWIAPNAVNITLNALGDKNRIQGSVASGAVIMCFVESIKAESAGGEPGNGDGLWYGANHEPKRWPLSLSPTYFNSYTHKYVYVAIPRSTSVGTQAVIVFPSDKLDIYGRVLRVENGVTSYEQVGSTDYFYVWLQGIIGAADAVAYGRREWEDVITDREWGLLETAQGREEQASLGEWYKWSSVSQTVTFLKKIVMAPASWFHNLIIGSGTTQGNLNGVAKTGVTSEQNGWNSHIVTPGYLDEFGNTRYLRKDIDDVAEGNIGFLNGLWIGVKDKYYITKQGIASLYQLFVNSITAKSIQVEDMKSANYTGDGMADTGWRLSNNHNGHSKLTIDELYVRMKAVFESLEVRERTYTGGDQIWSCAGNYVSRTDYMGNAVDPSTGDEITDDLYEDGTAYDGTKNIPHSRVPRAGDTYGYSTVEVPWLLRGAAMVLGKNNGLVSGLYSRYAKVRIVIPEEEETPAASRGARSATPAINQIRRVRCYFLAKDDDREIHNWWRINDLARCQTMNLANTNRETYISGRQQKAGNVFWWRKVIFISTEPVQLDDGKWYHFFDVAFNNEIEESTDPAIHGTMATFAMEGSDIPAATDSVVQFGNTINPGRMNLMMMEVNGGDAEVGYAPTGDAPCLKAYRGIYCFDLSKCWVGGRTCKMKLSPSTGYEFYGPNFKQVTEYDVVPVPVDRGLWTDITPTRDDYRTHDNVRKCYYYDKVSHNGSYWLCSIVEGSHWVNGDGNYITDAQYAALTLEQQAMCERRQNYTIDEPSAESYDWTMLVSKGAPGASGETPAMLFKTAQHGATVTAPVCTAANYMNDILPQGWSKSAPNRQDGYDVLMSQNTIVTDANGNYVLKETYWSTPTRISGDDGDPGADATDREWIYIGDTEYRSTYADSTHPHPKDILTDSEGVQRTSEYIHSHDDFVPQGWNDTAIATDDSSNKFVYASWRDKPKGSDTWHDFNNPILWSNWGVQGIDGDGVQYIFKLFATKLTAQQEQENVPTNAVFDQQTKEWMPVPTDPPGVNNGWSDDPLTPTSAMPYCYCSVIKKINGEWRKNGNIGIFEKLGLWTCFTGSQQEYIQTLEAWSNDEATTDEFTPPATDYSAAEGQPGSAGNRKDADWKDFTPTNANDYAYLWRCSRKMVLKDDGTYEPENQSGTPTVNGTWRYVRLSGTNGTSIKIQGLIVAAEAGSVTLPTTGVSVGDLGIKQGDDQLYRYNGTTWEHNGPSVSDGDSYTVTKDCVVDLEQDNSAINIKGHLIMWSDEAHTQSSSKGWVDLGEFKGDPGTTYYTHIAWASGVTLADNEHPVPSHTPTQGQISVPNAYAVTTCHISPFDGATHMGTLIDTVAGQDETNKFCYTWQKVLGPQGPQGGRTATVYLYKRGASPIDTVGISSTLYYKFADKLLYTDSACTTVATTQLNGWSLDIPSGTDPIYVTAAVAYSETVADDIGSNEWVTPALFTGEHGINTATVFLYKRAASAPDDTNSNYVCPQVTLYYKFSDGLLYTYNTSTHVYTVLSDDAAALYGWKMKMPATDGNPCYVIQAAALSTEAYDAIEVEKSGGTYTKNDWSSVRKLVEDGADGNGIVSITRTFAISSIGTTASETTEPTHQGSWTVSSPAVTEQNPYLWAKEEVVFTDTTKNTTKYYCIGAKGDPGIDAQDFEWVYVLTTTETPPTIVAGSGADYWKQDDFKPLAQVSSGRIKGNGGTEASAGSPVQCTDDPQGVNDTWKFEWEMKRTKGAAVNGRREWNNYTPGEAMTLHNNYAETAFVIDISNDNDQFGTDSNGVILPDQQVRSTVISMYFGSQAQELNADNASTPGVQAALTYEDGTSVPSTVATVSYGRNSSDHTKGNVVVTIGNHATQSTHVTFPSEHSGLKVHITAACAMGTKSIDFPIQQVKSGAPGVSPTIYQLNPTNKSFVFNRDANSNLIPANRLTVINALKTIGNTTTDVVLADNLTFTWGFDETATAEGSGTVGDTTSNTINVSNTQAASHYQVWIQLSTGDRDTLPVLKDGSDANEINPNILRRTIFENGKTAIQEAWNCGNWDNTYVPDLNSNTIVDGRKSVLLDALSLSSSFDFYQNVYGRIKTGTWYTLSFYSFSTTAWETYIYSGTASPCIDTNAGVFVDGEPQQSPRADGYVSWPSGWTGARHIVTFKTVGTFPTTDVYIMFRALAGAQIAICMPKLEYGRVATAYLPHEEDQKGDKGDDGKDGWSYWAEPENVFIVQHYDDEVSFDSVTVEFKAMKGGAPVAINSLSNIASTEFNAAQKGSSGDDAKKVVVSSPKTHTVDGVTEYYTKGYLTLTLNVTDPDTGSAVTFPITVACFAQLMGKITTKIKGDVETTVASKLGFKEEGSDVYSIEAAGTYIRSASEKTDKVSETVTNLSTANPDNLFGFTKGIVFNSNWPVIPYIQGYGFEVYKSYSSDGNSRRRGRVYNLGFAGEEGYYVLSCEMKVNAKYSNERFDVQLCDQVPSSVICGLDADKKYVPEVKSGSPVWTKVAAVFELTREKLGGSFDNLMTGLWNGFIDVESDTSSSTKVYVRKLQIERGTVPSVFGICKEDEEYASQHDHEWVKDTTIPNAIELDDTNKWDFDVQIFEDTHEKLNDDYEIFKSKTIPTGPTRYDIGKSNLILAANTPYTTSFWAKANAYLFVGFKFGNTWYTTANNSYTPGIAIEPTNVRPESYATGTEYQNSCIFYFPVGGKYLWIRFKEGSSDITSKANLGSATKMGYVLTSSVSLPDYDNFTWISNSGYSTVFPVVDIGNGCEVESYLTRNEGTADRAGDINSYVVTYGALDYCQSEENVNDGQTKIRLTTSWRKYYVHHYAERARQNSYGVGVRITSATTGFVSVAGVKLEEGYITSYNRTDYKTVVQQTARSIDMSVFVSSVKKAGIELTTNQQGEVTTGVIRATADQFEWQNTDGEQILGLDSEGNAEFAGVIKAKELYHRTCAVSSGKYFPETYQYIGNSVDSVAKYGTIFEWSEIYADTTLYERFLDPDYNSEFVMCTGKADVVNYVSYETGGILMLPDPKECLGKVIDVFSCHLGNHQTPIAQDTYTAKTIPNRIMVTQLEVKREVYDDGWYHSDRLWFEDRNYSNEHPCIFGVPMKFVAVELQETHGGPTSYAWWCISGQRMTT